MVLTWYHSTTTTVLKRYGATAGFGLQLGPGRAARSQVTILSKSGNPLAIGNDTDNVEKGGGSAFAEALREAVVTRYNGDARYNGDGYEEDGEEPVTPVEEGPLQDSENLVTELPCNELVRVFWRAVLA